MGLEQQNQCFCLNLSSGIIKGIFCVCALKFFSKLILFDSVFVDSFLSSLLQNVLYFGPRWLNVPVGGR